MKRVNISIRDQAFEILETKRGRLNRSAFLNGILIKMDEQEQKK